MGIGSTPEPHPPSETADSSANISDVLMTLWQQRRQEVVDHLERLIALLQDGSRHPGDSAVQIEAAQIAHQLHGVFGVFGLSALKDRLSAIEQALVGIDPRLDGQITMAQSVLAELP